MELEHVCVYTFGNISNLTTTCIASPNYDVVCLEPCEYAIFNDV